MACTETFYFSSNGSYFQGNWTLEDSQTGFSIQRIADGFVLRLVARIASKQPLPRLALLSGLHADIKDGASPGRELLGTAFDRNNYWIQAGQIPETVAYLEWRGNMAAFEKFEANRVGHAPQLVLSCRGFMEFQEMLTLNVDTRKRPPETRSVQIRTSPMQIACEMTLNLPKDAWVAAINSAGLRQAILVEIPLPPARPEPWASVWEALDEARRYFDQGGTTGWNGCVTAVRKALDAWQQIDGEKTEWEATKPKRDELEAKSKDDRFKGLRWQLQQCAHLAPHSPDKEWTRDDAVLMLATLSGLLVTRKP
jgi:hypothetical protein